MANRDVLVIGTSAGGIAALCFLAKQLPASLEASVFVTLHLSPQFPSVLDAVLTRSGPLPATFAKDGETFERGRIYIAPPERHLLVDHDRVLLGTGPRENSARPAIDPMFRSAAVCCGARAVGVLLTGTLGDGAAGLRTLKQSGGVAVVQDPSDAAYPEMPATALSLFEPDLVVRLAAMPALLVRLVEEPAGETRPVSAEIRYEVQIAKDGRATVNDMDRIGRRAAQVCPDCGGAMWEINDGDLVRYRCHVGHAYTVELMGLALDDSVRRAFATALRTLDDSMALAKKLRQDATTRGHSGLAKSWDARLTELEQQADVIRDAINRADKIAARAALPQ
jgi:two-component system, chemotaxis family, protein-glutamate methylesterase/glutaminase